MEIKDSILVLFKTFKTLEEQEMYKLLLLHSYYTGQSFCIRYLSGDYSDTLYSDYIESALHELITENIVLINETPHVCYYINPVAEINQEVREYHLKLTEDYNPSQLITDRSSYEYRTGDTLNLVNQYEEQIQKLEQKVSTMNHEIERLNNVIMCDYQSLEVNGW